jgi:hypothetical protein
MLGYYYYVKQSSFIKKRNKAKRKTMYCVWVAPYDNNFICKVVPLSRTKKDPFVSHT